MWGHGSQRMLVVAGMDWSQLSVHCHPSCCVELKESVLVCATEVEFSQLQQMHFNGSEGDCLSVCATTCMCAPDWFPRSSQPVALLSGKRGVVEVRGLRDGNGEG